MITAHLIGLAIIGMTTGFITHEAYGAKSWKIIPIALLMAISAALLHGSN